MSHKTASPGSTVSDRHLSQSGVPRWQLFQGNGVTPKREPEKPIGKNTVKRFDPEKARTTVTTLLLFAHYGFALWSTTRGMQLSWHASENGLDMLGMLAGIIMADLVLVASMEGIRHGVFVGGQKRFAWIVYFASAIGVGMATFAHGTGAEFQRWYTHDFLSIEALIMSFIAFVLLTTFYDVRIDNRKRAAQHRIRWREDMAELLTEEVKIDRFVIDLDEAKKRNGAYKKHLRSSGVGAKVTKQLQAAADDAAPRIMGLLGFQEMEVSGDSGAAKPEEVVMKPTKKGLRGWFKK